MLAALREAGGQMHSGALLSEELGVSRAQIWKHVETLRRRGYAIEGTSGGGYRLTARPDRLYPEEILPELATRWLGRDFHHLDVTDSTNRVAFELAREGAPHGATVIAEEQTAGRGRLGRSFYSPANENLYASIVLRPALDTVAAPTLIPAAAIAVAETVAASVPDSHPVEIKWPNDIWLDGLKVAGILMEMSAEATRVDFAVLGIGVNLNIDRARFPREFRAQATSLRAQTGERVDRTGFACRLFAGLEAVLDAHAEQGFPALRPRYLARFALQDRQVRIEGLGGVDWRGTVRGISASGALEVEREQGDLVEVIAGDVTLVRPDLD